MEAQQGQHTCLVEDCLGVVIQAEDCGIQL